MQYLYQRGKRRRVMHLQRFTVAGEQTFEALCGICLDFDTSINVPLCRRVCRRCQRRAEAAEEVSGEPQYAD